MCKNDVCKFSGEKLELNPLYRLQQPSGILDESMIEQIEQQLFSWAIEQVIVLLFSAPHCRNNDFNNYNNINHS